MLGRWCHEGEKETKWWKSMDTGKGNKNKNKKNHGEEDEKKRHGGELKKKNGKEEKRQKRSMEEHKDKIININDTRDFNMVRSIMSILIDE